jgi:predicted RND superfamily exporter protein
MWTKLAHIVLKNRLTLIIILGVITVFMGYKAKDVEFTYSFFTPVPMEDPDMQYFTKFKKNFGEDANIVAIGIKDSSLYEVNNFRRFKYLSDEILTIKGVKQVVSIPLFQYLKKDSKNKRFVLEPIFDEIPDSQVKLDSLLTFANEQRFFSDQIINKENGATFILISIDNEVLNTKGRDVVIKDIEHVAFAFEENTKISLRYVGLPYIRTEVNGSVKVELQIFLVASLCITALILLFFFRSWDAVVFPLIVIIVIVIWSMGTLGIFGYKITILTGLLPPIIVVIGIPNSIYLLNRYHQQINSHGNKARALSHVIRKIGLVAFITNFTTAVGFLVLTFTGIKDLQEFGLVASINIMATFLVSIILIPAVFSYLPTPHGKQLKHLKFKTLDFVLTTLDLIVHRHRYRVFLFTGVVVTIAVFGLLKLRAETFIVDDVPESSQVKKDLKFFEENFSGIMPLEIVVDSGKKKGILRQDFLEKVSELEDFLNQHDFISKPVSVVSMLKASRQAFYNNNPDYYDLPTRSDRNFILRYFSGDKSQSALLKSFVDEDQQIMRISLKVADVGSIKLDSLLDNVVNKKIDELFKGTDIKAKATGTTLLFVKGNKFLVQNLRLSLILAFVIIAIIMGILFKNLKMIAISLIPNLIPLIMIAGIMGYFNIALRPSTVLIFSVVFGISVDDSIHFLAKYRQELFANNFFVPMAISKSIRETGASMIYTSVVLFAGFIIFSGSEFIGTTMLGVLTSTTLLIAMFANLIVLPALLMVFDDGKRQEDAHPIIEHYDEFYQEDDDEEINLKKIKIQENGMGETKEFQNR